MTWHQWHHTALIASSTGLFVSRASPNAATPHERHGISFARLGLGEKRNSLTPVFRPARSCCRTDRTHAQAAFAAFGCLACALRARRSSSVGANGCAGRRGRRRAGRSGAAGVTRGPDRPKGARARVALSTRSRDGPPAFLGGG